jgi:uncharacterized membrane protein
MRSISACWWWRKIAVRWFGRTIKILPCCKLCIILRRFIFIASNWFLRCRLSFSFLIFVLIFVVNWGHFCINLVEQRRQGQKIWILCSK